MIALPQRFSGSKFKRTFGLMQEATANKQFGAKGFEADDGRFRWVLVQSQAACDYAQMRQGPLPFHLGLCLTASNARSSGHPAALWTSPCFEFDSDARFLHVNASFQVSLSPTVKVVEKPLFRLREQLLNELIGCRSHIDSSCGTFAWKCHHVAGDDDLLTIGLGEQRPRLVEA